MKFLYSDILPLGIEDGQQTVAGCITEQLSKANHVEIRYTGIRKQYKQRLP